MCCGRAPRGNEGRGAGLALGAGGGQLLEEVVALVVHEDEGGEVFDLDFPDGFHAEFGIFDALDGLDVVLSQDGGGSTDGAEVEAAVGFAGVGDLLRAVALGEHNHAAAVALEEVYVGVHAAGCGGTHGTAGHAGGRFGGTGVVDGVILEILGHLFAAVEAFLDLGVGDVAGHDDGAVEREAGRHGVLVELGENLGHGAVEIDAHHFAFAGIAEVFGDEAAGVVVEFLDPDAVAVDFALDVAVGRAAHAETYGAGGAVAGQAHDADVVGKVFAAELGAETDVACLFEQAGLELKVAEGATGFVARGGERVVVVGGGELDGEHGLLGAGAADDNGDVVGRTSRGAEGFHLADEEGHEGVGVEDGLGFLIEVALVGRSAAFGDAEEVIFVALGGFDVDLCGEVATGVDLVVHGEGGVLRVAEVFLGVGVVDAARDGGFVADAGPDLLAFLAVDDGGAGVLAEGQAAFSGDFGVAQEGEGNVAVVVGGFGVGEDGGYLLVVGAAQQEGDVAKGLGDHAGDAFGFDFEDGVTFEFAHTDVVAREEIVLGVVFAELEHGGILECGCLCHGS